ncbi:heterokaryon incompatibility protein-domain-containing protein [Tricladium varicosporioides]|nr:heterokaryon incompatibility protein-domain-containing protein [Hymenoscyphus varicosporioides]
MRLINVRTLDMEEYFGDNTPEYAILSHTWGHDEISFQEWTMLTQSHKVQHSKISDFEVTILQLLNLLPPDDIKQKLGYQKIIGCCEQAKRDGLNYVWIDTCCIDKTSSAELSEAINSMFEWYKSSKICYVYLSDVSTTMVDSDGSSAIRNSRWFTRGWTLQEFLAPNNLAFF